MHILALTNPVHATSLNSGVPLACVTRHVVQPVNNVLATSKAAVEDTSAAATTAAREAALQAATQVAQVASTPAYITP